MRFVVLVLVLALAACQSSDVSRQVGARCDSNAECAVQCLGPSGDWPDGFCTVPCDTTANCPEGTKCIDENAGVCVFSCTTDPDCAFLGTGYKCEAVDSKGAGTKVMVCRGG